MRPEIRIHEAAAAETVATARIVIGVIWLTRLLRDPIHELGHLRTDLWYPQGVMGLVPEQVAVLLLQPASLLALRIVTIGLVILVILGTRPHRATLLALVGVLVVYLGIGRGFGGHVNHRELVLLYVTALLVLLPCFDAIAVQPDTCRRTPAVYRASMVSLCLVVGVSYMFVGIARLTLGFPTVFEPDIMRGWLVERSLRPNPLGAGLTASLLDSRVSGALVPVMMPLTTLMEVLAPAALWLRQGWRIVLLAGLASMHVLISLLMNIVFIENALLLVLFLDYTPWLPRGLRR